MSFYQKITMMQEPFDGGLDEKQRSKIIFNILATKTPSDTFLEEIANKLETAGVGTRNTSIFVSSSAVIPPGSGPYLSITETGGTGPLRIHNSASPAQQRPGAQIVARAGDYSTARTMARAAYDALVVVVNQTLTT